MSLATKLKELRTKKNKSLQQVADGVGASKTHIWDLERGEAKNPSTELLTKLANYFQVSVADLIGENPFAPEESPELIAMYREFKTLTDADRETIKMMMDRLKERKTKDG